MGQASRLWFFSDPAAVHRLHAEAARLMNEPFVKFQHDCVWLPERLHVAAGSVSAFNIPRCDADYSRHVHNDRILNFLRGKVDDPASALLAQIFAELPLPERKKRTAFIHYFDPPFMPGDLLLTKSESKREDRGVWHMPVMLDDHSFVHCAFPGGVTEGDILAPNYSDRLVALFRARAL